MGGKGKENCKDALAKEVQHPVAFNLSAVPLCKYLLPLGCSPALPLITDCCKEKASRGEVGERAVLPDLQRGRMMGKHGAQEGNCWVMTNEELKTGSTELSLSRPQLDAPPPPPHRHWLCGGAWCTSPSTANCVNCSEGSAELQKRPRNQSTGKSSGFSKSVRWPGRQDSIGFDDTGLPSLVLGPTACRPAQGLASAHGNRP